MAKIDQAKEKRERNEIYALKYKKKRDPKAKKKPAVFANWCRTKGHLPSCWVLDCPGQ